MSRALLTVLCLALAVATSVAGDTTRVMTTMNVPFFWPQGLWDTYANMVRAKYTVDIRQSNGLVFHERGDSASNAPFPGSPGRTFAFRVNHVFTDPGVYLVTRTLSGVDERGKKVNISKQLLVDVSYPTLTAPLIVDPTYYYAESATINFAAVEYNDKSLYRYKIETADGDSVFGENKSFVVLDSLLHDVDNARAGGKSFVVRGYYDNKQFIFRNPPEYGLDSTVWRFRILPPRLDLLTVWSNSGDYKPDSLFLDVGQKKRCRFGPTEIRFLFLNEKGNAWIRTSPKLTLSVSASDGFLSKGNEYEIDSGDPPWYTLVIHPDSAYLSTIARGKYRSVQINISGKDQFDQPVSEVLKASIIRPPTFR